MTAAAFALQTAIHEWLASDTVLTAMLSADGFSDAPTQGARFPYVTFGRATGYDWSSVDTTGEEVFLTLQAWSSKRGRKETAGIIARIDERLRGFDPEMEGFRLVLLARDLQEVRYDPEMALCQGLTRYRALLEETATE